MAKNVLKGSERTAVAGATAVTKADPAERLEVTVVLRRSNAAEFAQHLSQISQGQPAAPLSREEFDAKYGASQEDIEAVRDFAREHGLTVVQEHAGRRSIVLSGTVAAFNSAFGVELQRYVYDAGSYRGREGHIFLPDSLDGRVEAVLGLDNRPAARPKLRGPVPADQANRKAANASSFTPLQIAHLYDFPKGSGKGECVAIIELGGGEKPVDLKTYFTGLGLTPQPKVSVVSVDHAPNDPTGDPDGPDGEVMLDIEVVGAIAREAHIVVYFASNTTAGFLDAITTAIHDTTNRPSVISISWGGAESTWTPQAMESYDQAFQSAAVMGITVCVAAGDGGSSDGVASGNHVDFPASSPHVLACGGTSIQETGGIITSEVVWNDGAQGGAGGGGVSSVFALPSWQQRLSATRTGGLATKLAMRGVPDVSGNADPETGWDVRIDGTDTVIGGTSAVAPMWAGLIARINAAKHRKVGFINPTLYANPAALNDVTRGNNGAFEATTGWDAASGLGSPSGTKVEALF